MKQRFYSLFLTALLGMLGTPVWALLSTTTIDGVEYYEISSATDLADFAALVNEGEYAANAILTADIDMTGADIADFPIGGPDAGVRYTGTFDGQGHKISNFQLVNTSAPTNFGMFNTNTGVVLKNFWLDETCKIEGTQVVSLIGRHDGGGTFEGVGNCADVTGTNNNVGGLFGGVFGQSNNKMNVYIINCWTMGKVTSTNTSASNYKDCGALAGWFNNANITITNFWTVAEVANYKSESTYIIRSGNGATFTATGCYSKYGAEGQEKVSFTAITDAQVQGGELCYLLNGDQTAISWYQTLADDKYPVPYSSHDIVYINGRQHCDGTAYEDGSAYANENLGVVADDHDFADGICSYCGTPDEEYATLDAEGNYEIDSEAKLIWFSAIVSKVNSAANAVLTADIALTKEWTSPIATYAGFFDGQGHEITGFQTTSTGKGGLFGYVKGATVGNFSISGSLTATAGTGSGVIGWAENSSIYGIQSVLVVSVPNDDVHHTAGVVGSSQSGNTISGCSFTGSVEVAGNTRDCFGGVCGYVKADNVDNCANYGTVSYTKADGYVGGVIGYINNASAYVQNCLNMGTITYTGEDEPAYGGALVGRLANHTAANIQNSYWLETSASQASGQNVPAAFVSVTSDELASGEVAAKLGEAWGQVLGTDTYPALDDAKPRVYQLSVTDAGYASFVPTVNVAAAPAGVTVYAGQKDGEYIHLKEVRTIQANVAYIVKAEEGDYYYNSTDAVEDILIASDLTYSDVDVTADGSQYILAKEGDTVGFYKATPETTIPARKVFIVSTSGVKGFCLDDEATAIEMVNGQSSMVNGQPIYNLAGQRLVKTQKGINIVGGKKVMF